METIIELKVDVTIISGDSRLADMDKETLEKTLKELIGADDLHITGYKVFERDDG